jgi:hypothetical protein
MENQDSSHSSVVWLKASSFLVCLDDVFLMQKKVVKKVASKSFRMMHPALKTSEVETEKVEEGIVNNIVKVATNAWQEIV